MRMFTHVFIKMMAAMARMLMTLLLMFWSRCKLLGTNLEDGHATPYSAALFLADHLED